MAITGLHIANQNRWDEDFGRAGLAIAETYPEKLVVDESNDNLGGWPGENDLLTVVVYGGVSGKHVVEFGSGRGRLSTLLARRGARVTGIDIGPNLVELAGKVAAANGVADQCTFRIGDITQLDLTSACADIVVGEAVLHHLDPAGLKRAVAEAHRILRPAGLAVFLEPVENSKLFEFLQNLIPIPGQRPSIIQRKKWRGYLETLDDRSLTDQELRQAGRSFRLVHFRHRGLVIRLNNFVTSRTVRTMLGKVDSILTNPLSPFKRFSQSVIVTYRK
jgi:2-polyprenyl-3-methyl-5-hydroxy-6-metoxy-1,4-benzoquinol methylase